MLTAIILCRKNSRRLKSKHFYKIGKLPLIENLIGCISLNKNINEIFLATGSKKKNFIFEKKLKNRYKNIKYYYHQNEYNVTERVANLSKKIKNNYFVLVSGDCPLVDNNYINTTYKTLIEKKKYDLIQLENSTIEGHNVYKKKIWHKINKLSKHKDYKEHPGLVLKYKKKEFQIKNIDANKSKRFQKFKEKNKIRMSVDTKSDLDFFNLSYQFLKKQKKFFNYENVQSLKKINDACNSHVVQQTPFVKRITIYLITSKSNKIGLGHYKRSQSLKREIEETTNYFVKLVLLKNNKDLKKINKLKNNFLIIDLPKDLLNKIYFKYKPKKTIFIDNTKKLKNIINIVPGITKFDKNYLSGKKYLIINRDINFINHKFKKIENYNIVIPGGVSKVPSKIIKFCAEEKKEKFIFVINKKNNYKIINFLKKNNIQFLDKPKNFFSIIKQSKRQIIRHGVLTYEMLALNKKPFVWKYNEPQKRIKDINYLNKKGLINIFNKKNFLKTDYKLGNQNKFKTGAEGVLKEIIKFTKKK